MFSDKELETNKAYIQRKKEDILNKEGGSDIDYIRNLQTLIQLENTVDEKMEKRHPETGNATKYEEALAWIRGERSMTNLIPQDPFETWQVRIAQADAAMMQQAYWIIRAHKEGLLD